MPDPILLFRIISGEKVFGLEVDSKIRQAANSMTARLMLELFKRCDDSDPHWQTAFADSLDPYLCHDPAALVGFDDGKWNHLPCGDAGKESSHETAVSEHYLILRFGNSDAAYYQYHLTPKFDEPFISGTGRKREGELVHLRIEFDRPDVLQLFIEGLRGNEHLVSIEESSAEVFAAAPSHRV